MDKRLEEVGFGIPDKERKFHPTFWKFYAYLQMITKLRLLVENNFRYVETLSLFATARYVFEALVWLRVLRRDQRYGLVGRLSSNVVTSVQQAKEQKRKMENEIRFYEELAKDEEEMLDHALKAPMGDKKLGQTFDFIEEE